MQTFEKEIHENGRFVITSLSIHFPFSSSRNCADKIEFRKLCVHWVPTILTDKHEEKRQGSTPNELLSLNEEDSNDFLNRIVIGDETRVSHVTPESKQQSSP